jgi:hypothetical protein
MAGSAGNYGSTPGTEKDFSPFRSVKPSLLQAEIHRLMAELFPKITGADSKAAHSTIRPHDLRADVTFFMVSRVTLL